MPILSLDPSRQDLTRVMTALVTLVLLAPQRSALPAEAAPGCELHDTCVSWAPDLATARDLARDQSKLLFVMHLSGNFTNPVFT